MVSPSGRGGMFLADEVVAAKGCCWFGWLPLAAPGIPRSRRFAGSRSFRRAKGAWWLVGVLGCFGGGLVGVCPRFPLTLSPTGERGMLLVD